MTHPCYLRIMIFNNWQKEAEQHQKEYKQFLRKANLAGGKKMRNLILKRLPEFHEEAFRKIDCLQCANCCKNHSPRFKQPDIKRIAKRLRIKEGDLIHNYLRLDEENDYVTRSSPCPFLQEDNTCFIYEDRPGDCLRYPYTDEDVLVDRVQLTLKNATVCPITFFVLERIREKFDSNNFGE